MNPINVVTYRVSARTLTRMFVITVAGSALGHVVGKAVWSAIKRERKKEFDDLKEFIDRVTRGSR